MGPDGRRSFVAGTGRRGSPCNRTRVRRSRPHACARTEHLRSTGIPAHGDRLRQQLGHRRRGRKRARHIARRSIRQASSGTPRRTRCRVRPPDTAAKAFMSSAATASASCALPVAVTTASSPGSLRRRHAGLPESDRSHHPNDPPRGRSTRGGPVVAVSAYGRVAGVPVAPHELDCIHPVVWQPGSRVIRVGTAAPCSPDSETVPLDVELTAGSISQNLLLREQLLHEHLPGAVGSDRRGRRARGVGDGRRP